MTVANVETSNHNENVEIHLSLNSEMFINIQNDDFFVNQGQS